MTEGIWIKPVTRARMSFHLQGDQAAIDRAIASLEQVALDEEMSLSMQCEQTHGHARCAVTVEGTDDAIQALAGWKALNYRIVV